MTGSQIRRRFLEHFASRDHRVLPSYPLVLPWDPTTLFTIAGMQPLKPYFQGLSSPPAPRLVSSQKCFRTADLEEIGKTDRHATFMEMLGNFAPTGDYFKETAIPLAWELVTGGFGLDPERISVTIHPDDEDAHTIWTGKVGLPSERVHRNDKAWWSPGPTGPCGPCSELFYDRGIAYGCQRPDCYPEHCDRYLEFWNLVFMQFDAQPDGRLEPLPRPGIDTGMGLERITSILQGVDSIFETDLLRPLVDFVRQSAGVALPASERKVADHLRAMTFLIADGVVPANEGRGYVLRRVIRRAALHASRLQMSVSLAEGVPLVSELMGDQYPEVVERQQRIRQIIADETDRFQRTLEQGMERFETMVAKHAAQIPGLEAFKLHDTFGFPLELTRELAFERGIGVDEAGFTAAMEEQRRSSGGAAIHRWLNGAALPSTTFEGHVSLELDARIIGLRHQGVEVEQALEGEEVILFLDRTPFYAESGGQVGDTGTIDAGMAQVRIEDTQKPAERAIAHLGTVTLGTVSVGAGVTARVDPDRRRQVAGHHSATHLLHKALRETLGEGAVQRGSLVAPDHTTFDFVLNRPLSAEELEGVNRRVNEQIRAGLPFRESRQSYAEAVASGAMHLFEEKYGDVVRVVCFGDWTCELCGGTHVANTAQLGLALIVSEASIGSGLRRIEMVVGEAAERLARRRMGQVGELARSFGVPPDQVLERLGDLRAQLKQKDRQIHQLEEELVLARTRSRRPPDRQARVPVAVEALSDSLAVDLKSYADRLLESLDGHGVVAVTQGGRYVIKVSEDLSSELDATSLKQDFGKGGGSARMVQGRLEGTPEAAFDKLLGRLR